MTLSKRFLFFTGLFLWLSLGKCFATEINVSVERNSINLNESFQLVFSANQSPDDEPDFSVLTQNFEILSQASGSQISIINGDTTKNVTWTLMLMAKRAGKLIIPMVAFGHDTSSELSLTVNAVNNNSLTNKEIFLNVSVSPETAYVQSQLIYTLKFYRRVGIAQASLGEPVLADAVIEKLGEDKNYSTEYNGQQYAVTERSYAIFPQKSGEMTIAPIQLIAEVVTNNRPKYNGFFTRQMTKRQAVNSNAITLNVLPIPSVLSGKPWFPAEVVQLQENWSIDRLQVPVGEPITRTLTLFAKGAMPSQLPEFNQALTLANIKTYPDQATLKQSVSNEGIIAVREEKIAIIPEVAGNYQLPAIEIPWWNTTTNTLQIARIPATTITAVSNANNNLTMPAATIMETTAKPQAINPIFWMALAGFFAIIWLFTLIYFLSRRSKPIKAEIIIEKNLNLKDLKKACLANNPRVTKDILIDWGRQKYQVSNLGKLAEYCQSPLTEEINELNHYLYSSSNDNWQGLQLWRAFNAKPQQMDKQVNDDNLEPLHSITESSSL